MFDPDAPEERKCGTPRGPHSTQCSTTQGPRAAGPGGVRAVTHIRALRSLRGLSVLQGHVQGLCYISLRTSLFRLRIIIIRVRTLVFIRFRAHARAEAPLAARCRGWARRFYRRLGAHPVDGGADRVERPVDTATPRMCVNGLTCETSKDARERRETRRPRPLGPRGWLPRPLAAPGRPQGGIARLRRTTLRLTLLQGLRIKSHAVHWQSFHSTPRTPDRRRAYTGRTQGVLHRTLTDTNSTPPERPSRTTAGPPPLHCRANSNF